MTILISSSDNEKMFKDKNLIIVGTTSDCDYKLKLNYQLKISVKFDEKSGKCIIINLFDNRKVLFRGEPFIGKLVIDKFCKLKFLESDEFLGVKLVDIETNDQVKTLKTSKEYQPSPELLIKLDNRKKELDRARVTIVKEIAFAITDIKKRLSLNFKTSIFLNIALAFSAILVMFGVTNYLVGLPISDTVAYLTMPTNIKLLFLFSIIGYGVSLCLKQGVYLFLQNSDIEKPSSGSKFSQYFLIFVSTFFSCVFYVINLIYYMNPDNRIVFAILISLFFIILNMSLAFACAHFKYIGHKLSLKLNEYEYREDFEIVLNQYQSWIELFLNNLNSKKLTYIKDRIFKLQLKSWGEIGLGILTAPFLAYGVSNTLAMCFPEAAGWIRISGLRFSLVFLILSTVLIIFAFFTLSSAFVNIRKIGGSDIIKLDGFRNYLFHGVDIFGLQKVRSLKQERVNLLGIGFSIIFIEFVMNTSFFMSEIGADLSGLFISLIAASVPTALLIAETYILSSARYELFVCDSIISKMDR